MATRKFVRRVANLCVAVSVARVVEVSVVAAPVRGRGVTRRRLGLRNHGFLTGYVFKTTSLKLVRVPRRGTRASRGPSGNAFAQKVAAQAEQDGFPVVDAQKSRVELAVEVFDAQKVSVSP